MNKKAKELFSVLKTGLLDQNPIFVQLLGLCPTLATTTSVPNAVGMGLAATFVLACSNALISLLRKFIPNEVRIAGYIVIISGFVSMVQMLIKAYFPSLDKSLGVFIPLIVVNCIILARAEAFASKNPVLPSLMDGIGMGLGFTGALTIIASVREVMGAGTFSGIRVTPAGYEPVQMMIMPYGAFITLGILMAAVAFIRKLSEKIIISKAETVENTSNETSGVNQETNKIESEIKENISSDSSKTNEKNLTGSDTSENVSVTKASGSSDSVPSKDDENEVEEVKN
jgi:electron transport complex protein RnfE